MAANWSAQGTATWATDGTSRKIQGYIYVEKIENNSSIDDGINLKFKVTGYVRDGDGSGNYYNSEYTCTVKLQYKVKSGSWVNLKTGTFTTDASKTFKIPSGFSAVETPLFTREKDNWQIYFRILITGPFNDANATVDFPINKLASYTVSYNANGGTGAPNSQTKYYGTSLTITSTTPSKSNTIASVTAVFTSSGGSSVSNKTGTITYSYAFGGWRVGSTTSTTILWPNKLYSTNASTTLYAHYNTSINYPTITLASAPTWQYHRFNYWKIDTTTYAAGAKYTFTSTASVTATANWTDPYTISYNANKGDSSSSTTPAAQSKTPGVNLTLTSTIPTKSNTTASVRINFINDYNTSSAISSYKTGTVTYSYNFNYWRVGSATSTTTLAKSGIYKTDATTTLYANWTTNTSYPTMTLAATPTKTGYDFTGWFTAASGGTSKGTGSATYNPTALTTTLYGQWKEKEYRISYNANGGNSSSTPATQIKKHFSNLTITSAIPSKNNTTTSVTINFINDYFTDSAISSYKTATATTTYSFVNWNTNSTGTGTSYSPSTGVYGTNATATLYATWTAANPTYSSVTLAASPTKTNYNFLGWFTAASDGEKIGDGGVEYTYNSDQNSQTFYGQWERNIYSYTITYDGNSPSSSTASYIVSNIPAEQTVTGTVSSIPNVQISNQIPLLNDKNISSTDFRIRYFDPKNGENIFSVQGTQPMYSFDGWNTESDGSGTVYTSTDTYTISADLILYAQWNDSQASWRMAWPSNPIYKGHNFQGWYRTSDDTLIDQAPSSIFELEDSTYASYYAKWNSISYNLIYESNCDEEGSIDNKTMPSNVEGIYGDLINIAYDANPQRTGSSEKIIATLNYQDNSHAPEEIISTKFNYYTFKDWNTESNGEGITYNIDNHIWNTTDENSGATNNNLTLYAQWIVQSKYPTIYLPILNSDNLTLGTFAGWYTSANYDEDSFIGYGDNYYILETTTNFYAKWKASSYQIKYDANGGDNAPETQTKNWGESLTLPSNGPDAPNSETYTVNYVSNWSDISITPSDVSIDYSFDSWNTKKDGTGISYALGATYSINSNNILWAQWNKTFDPEEITLPDPIVTSYNFDGWYKDSSTLIKIGNGGDTYTPSNDITLYGKWSIKKYTISYYGIARQLPANQEKEYGKNIFLSNLVPTRAGYVFKGWATQEDGGGTLYQPETEYDIDANLSLYAQWREIKTLSEWLTDWEKTNATAATSSTGTIIISSAGNNLQLVETDIQENSIYTTPKMLVATATTTILSINQQEEGGNGNE